MFNHAQNKSDNYDTKNIFGIWLLLRSNHSTFINKDISKAIMNRTRLRNRFLKEVF